MVWRYACAFFTVLISFNFFHTLNFFQVQILCKCIGRYVWGQLLLHFYVDLFETPHLSSSWYKHVHVLFSLPEPNAQVKWVISMSVLHRCHCLSVIHNFKDLYLWAINIPMLDPPSSSIRLPQFQRFMSRMPVLTKFHGLHHWAGGKAALGFGPCLTKTLVTMATNSSQWLIKVNLHSLQVLLLSLYGSCT